MLHVAFNQDSTCFACGRENGFAVYNCDPPTERFNRLAQNDAEANGIGIIEMLFRSNIFALVGGGRSPKYPRNTLMIWDDFQTKCIAELEFNTPVTGVKLRRDIILVTIIDKVYVYKISDVKLLKSFDTYSNPKGLITMASGNKTVIAFLGTELGTVVIDNSEGNLVTIKAHDNGLSAMALNGDGSYLATASERGTLIRIWDTASGEKIREFRRGLEVVNIQSLVFDNDSSRLLVCSDKGTAHVFSLLQEESKNRKSKLSIISGYLPSYFGSEWSSVTFQVPPNSICTFSSNSVDTVYALTIDGQFQKYTYDTDTCTGKCVETISIEQMSSKLRGSEDVART